VVLKSGNRKSYERDISLKLEKKRKRKLRVKLKREIVKTDLVLPMPPSYTFAVADPRKSNLHNKHVQGDFSQTLTVA